MQNQNNNTSPLFDLYFVECPHCETPHHTEYATLPNSLQFFEVHICTNCRKYFASTIMEIRLGYGK